MGPLPNCRDLLAQLSVKHTRSFWRSLSLRPKISQNVKSFLRLDSAVAESEVWSQRPNWSKLRTEQWLSPKLIWTRRLILNARDRLGYIRDEVSLSENHFTFSLNKLGNVSGWLMNITVNERNRWTSDQLWTKTEVGPSLQIKLWGLRSLVSAKN